MENDTLSHLGDDPMYLCKYNRDQLNSSNLRELISEISRTPGTSMTLVFAAHSHKEERSIFTLRHNKIQALNEKIEEECEQFESDDVNDFVEMSQRAESVIIRKPIPHRT